MKQIEKMKKIYLKYKVKDKKNQLIRNLQDWRGRERQLNEKTLFIRQWKIKKKQKGKREKIGVAVCVCVLTYVKSVNNKNLPSCSNNSLK